ncbi:serpin B4-like [Oppia nitens]|uniref:serpin B4-like n=1 Tax=Oppia nitens TaxID=1686743 RepID=UPI0023D98CE9|nr:serpin B4-like [Oppia nitens]
MNCLILVTLLAGLLPVYQFMVLSNNDNNNNTLDTTNDKLVVRANNEFSFKIYKMLSKDDNDIVSSFSIISAFSILMNGANGPTLDNLKTFLRFQDQSNQVLSDQSINNGFEIINTIYENKSMAYRQFMAQTNESNRWSHNMKHEFNVANLVVRNDSEVLKQAFVDAIQLAFRAQVDRADFKNNAVAETEKVNQWVRNQTNNKIQKVFDKIKEETTLIIMNAVYFKGNWIEKFNVEDTRKSNFYNNGADNSAASVDTMSATHSYRYLDSQELNAQIIEIPYMGREMSFVIVLPKVRNGLSTLKTTINATNFETALKSMSSNFVRILIPKFKVEKEYDLMQDVNPKPIVLTTSADLSRLSNTSQQTVSEVKHKTYIAVDEKGTEAAAVTAIGLTRFSVPFIPPNPIEFKADHPFLYYIIDKTNGMILFSGQINKF